MKLESRLTLVSAQQFNKMITPKLLSFDDSSEPLYGPLLALDSTDSNT